MSAGGSDMGSEQYHNHNTIFFRQYFDQQRDINTIFLQKMIHNVTSTIFFDKIDSTPLLPFTPYTRYFTRCTWTNGCCVLVC